MSFSLILTTTLIIFSSQNREVKTGIIFQSIQGLQYLPVGSAKNNNQIVYNKPVELVYRIVKVPGIIKMNAVIGKPAEIISINYLKRCMV
jgi:hypothetical protein